MSAPQRPNSRDRLLDAAVELLQTKGPTASGTKEILERADAPRGSFYFHFPEGKDQLVAEAVGRAAVATRLAMVDALEDASIDLPARVEKLVVAAAAGLVTDDYRLGCAVGVTALETAATSSGLRQSTETAFATWTTLLVEHLTAAGLDPGRAAALADTIVAGLEGATMLARARRDTAPLYHVAASLKAAVAAELAER